jgi:Holliday junction resolvase
MKVCRTDANQTEIVLALRAAGAFVQSLAACGCGVPDLLVMRGGRIVLMEVKDGSKPESERRLTPAQVAWHKMAEAVGVTVRVVNDSGEALQAIGGP